MIIIVAGVMMPSIPNDEVALKLATTGKIIIKKSNIRGGQWGWGL